MNNLNTKKKERFQKIYYKNLILKKQKIDKPRVPQTQMKRRILTGIHYVVFFGSIGSFQKATSAMNMAKNIPQHTHTHTDK